MTYIIFRLCLIIGGSLFDNEIVHVVTRRKYVTNLLTQENHLINIRSCCEQKLCYSSQIIPIQKYPKHEETEKMNVYCCRLVVNNVKMQDSINIITGLVISQHSTQGEMLRIL